MFNQGPRNVQQTKLEGRWDQNRNPDGWSHRGPRWPNKKWDRARKVPISRTGHQRCLHRKGVDIKVTSTSASKGQSRGNRRPSGKKKKPCSFKKRVKARTDFAVQKGETRSYASDALFGRNLYHPVDSLYEDHQPGRQREKANKNW